MSSLPPVLTTWREPDSEVRIQLARWCLTEAVQDQFVERPKSLRMVGHYLRRIGPVSVWRKIVSRLAERGRNQKVGGVGLGYVVEAPTASEFGSGEFVAFFAPNHAPDHLYLTVDARLVKKVEGLTVSGGAAVVTELPPALRRTLGWSPFSGMPLDTAEVAREVARVAGSVLANTEVEADARGGDGGLPRPTERLGTPRGRPDRPAAALFGLGNYAKVLILPLVRRHLDVVSVHEIDPDQVEGARLKGVAVDTSPVPREDESYRAYFIAGYHHTHAGLAAHALTQGAYAVVEKPLATTEEQLGTIERAIASGPDRRLFACFHKRYSKLDRWAREDLGVEVGGPIDMYAIVYEIPLPPLHWYNWPNSGSRLISNGCHWLDYFMFVNDFSKVTAAEVTGLRGRDLTAWVTLDNGAQLVMTITDTGSQRLGVRDVIELRAGDTTARLVDATYYESENTRKRIRKRRANPVDAYRTMYRTIARKIADGEPADPLAALDSTRLTLRLEAALTSRTERF